MKLFILRHEERCISMNFYSNLTENGHKNSILLADKIKLLDIDIALLDYSPYVIKGNVEKFYKPYRKWRCCKK